MSPFHRLMASLAAAVVLGAGLTACAEERLTGVCDVVLDGSGSAKPVTGFDAGDRIKQELPRLLNEAGCRNVTFEQITGSSRAAYCRVKNLDVDPDVSGNVDRDSLRAARQDAAVKRAGDLLGCVHTDSREVPGSDVLGGLWRAVEERPAREVPYHLIVFSDFLATDPVGSTHGLNLYTADLTTPAKRRALIEQLAASGRIPNLSGVQLVTIGYGMLQSADPAKFAGFDAFWTELLKDKAKCALPPKKV
ncbi:hypothetical protein [Nonomuraea typhae]|uniref:DUF3558 domain-containing protein n=1 Tax=Nonomuraea typhae TaxID=2603600 RepID=A0ABW7YQG3_9ACTN